jgi:outer membrane autotransporter protein
VVSSTANVIDVYLNQNPSLQDMVDGELIDIVYVSGTSAAANFNLGIVDVEDDSLYTVDYELVKQINYSGTNDLFSLGFEISGLTPTGVAMSSIAPTVQNLWHLGVGTVFQREGTVRDLKSGGSSNSLMNAGFKNATGGNAQVADYQGAAGLWLRAFTEDGGLNPDGGRDNFGLGGAQSFDMKNSGIEFGAGYAFNSQWTAGLLGGVSDGSLKPTIGGRTSIDAKTIGGYLTYTPGNGFYADLSYRSMDFDGNGNGGGDDFSFDGKADGYSLEMGYGFKTSSGLVVEPQFQYSSMDVDLDSVDYNQGGFALDDGKSSQTRLGVSLRKTMDSGNGNSWTPYASLSYLNESNASNDYTIGGVLTGNVDTSGNSTLFEGGATVKYGNMLFSGGLNWKDGGAYESVFGGQVSVRFSW